MPARAEAQRFKLVDVLVREYTDIPKGEIDCVSSHKRSTHDDAAFSQNRGLQTSTAEDLCFEIGNSSPGRQRDLRRYSARAFVGRRGALPRRRFHGDGFADVAREASGTWQYAACGFGGFGGFVALQPAWQGAHLAQLPVGQFDGNMGADVILWSSVSTTQFFTPLYFQLSSRLQDPAVRWSSQDMR